MSMRIYFCDLCNESVPQADLDKKRAAMRNGRVVCARCEAAMSGSSGGAATSPVAGDGSKEAARPTIPLGASTTPSISAAPRSTLAPLAVREPSASTLVGGPPGSYAGAAGQPPAGQPVAPAPGRTGVGIAIALALVALVLASGSAAFFLQQLEEQRGHLDDQLALQDQRTARRLDEAAADGRTRVDEATAALDEASQRLGALDAEIDASRRDAVSDVQLLREELAGLGGRLDALDRTVTDAQRRDAEFARIGETVASLHAEVLRLTDKVHAVERGEGGAVAAKASSNDAAQPEWWPLVGDLSSQNSGARWGAVQALGETHDPAVAEYLAPMLKDPDIFVRMATARVLGDLRAVVGIPALIDALEDSEASVREAAVVSLREISGRDFRFDPTAKEPERAKRVKAWRDWWEKASEDLLGGASGI